MTRIGQQPSAVEPVLLKQPTAFDAIASTVKSLSDATRAWALTSRGSRDDAAGNEPANPADRVPRIVKSRWETVDSAHAPGSTRRMLVLIYDNGALAVWDTSDVTAWSLVLSLGDVGTLLDSAGLKREASIIDARLAQSSLLAQDRRTLLLIATQEADGKQGHVLAVDPQSLSVLQHVTVAGTLVELQTSSRRLLAATSAPTTLHMFDMDSLDPNDVVSSLADLEPGRNGEPVYSLARNGRLLAYATNTAVPSQYKGEQIRPGKGITSIKGFFDSSALDAATISIGSDFVRRVGGSVVSGVRTIGDASLEYVRRRAQEPSDAPVGEPMDGDPQLTSKTVRTTHGSPSTAVGTIKVIDLHTGRTINHFRSYWSPVHHLSFAPSSSYLFVAPAAAHHFDIFELRASPTKTAPVWHRYRLSRGLSSSEAIASSWTTDGRFVSVTTMKGTHHIYAIRPYGGAPAFDTHFAPQVFNVDEIQPLSVPLNAIARIRLDKRPDDGRHDRSPQAHRSIIIFSDKMQERSFDELVHRSFDNELLAKERLSSDASRQQDVVTFDNDLGMAVLHRITAQIMLTVASSTIAAASRGDVGKVAANAVSGLTQMMRATTEGSGQSSTVDWQISSTPRAIWTLTHLSGRTASASEWPQIQPQAPDVMERVSIKPCSQIEIETFSRSRKVSPRSVYQSAQFEFYSIPKGIADVSDVNDFDKAFDRLQMRPCVEVTAGSKNSRLALSSTSFDEPIQSAMRARLEPSSTSSSPVPASFPNGIPGRKGSWRDTVTTVGGKVREQAHVVQRQIRRGRRVEYSSSVSFEEDDDALFADVPRSEGSTAATSDAHLSGDFDDELDAIDAPWGLKGQPTVETAPKQDQDDQVTSHTSEEEAEDFLPFDP